MVDFGKHLPGKKASKLLHPVAIYETLDRASDKGPLRPAQIAVLNGWFDKFREHKDVILKLHTGQGKTLIGLLVLQARLNVEKGPCLYLCPDRFLVEQACTQASQFGIKFCTVGDDLPSEFLDGEAILITHVQMLFNGFSRFRLGPRSQEVGSIVIDDAHACLNSIRQAFTISGEHGTPAYNELLTLFSDALQFQGEGDFEEIRSQKANAVLPIPYWAWQDRSADVTKILVKHGAANSIKFGWPLLKSTLKDCLCLVSGDHFEISPHLFPLHMFGSYQGASHRIFMSATINDDSFLIKGLGVSPEAIVDPLRYAEEKWSGEKMVLIPSFIHESLNREVVVNRIAPRVEGRKYGVVAITPSFELAKLWEYCGAKVATKETINGLVRGLKSGSCDSVTVFANRYDGIDLPDNSCRILILDSRPFSEDLIDRYMETCRADSEVIETKLAQIVEQGMGRHIRGEKDYGVVMLIGPSLIRAVRSRKSRRFFSTQTRHQIEIGMNIAELAKEDLAAGKEPIGILGELIMQCINRDDTWKNYYAQKMNEMPAEEKNVKVLNIFVAEKKAEEAYVAGNVDRAVGILQSLLDNEEFSNSDRGWYLQEMARYQYGQSRVKSNELQVTAHRQNAYLLRPREGMVIQKLAPVAQRRVDAIAKWIGQFATYEDLSLRITELLDVLQFGIAAEKFEHALDGVGAALGFSTQRPDKQWKTGPDNLWCLKDNEYLLIECKSEVSSHRKEIHKEETGQMNNACAWFDEQYPGCTVHRLMIIPAIECASGAGFNHLVKVMRSGHLSKLRTNIRKFFAEFAKQDLKTLTAEFIESALNAHHLAIAHLVANYSETVKRHVH